MQSGNAHSSSVHIPLTLVVIDRPSLGMTIATDFGWDWHNRNIHALLLRCPKLLR